MNAADERMLKPGFKSLHGERPWRPWEQQSLVPQASLVERIQSLTYRVAKRILDNKRSTRGQLESALAVMEDMHEDMKG